MFFCIFVVFGLEIYSKSVILVPKSTFRSPKRIFLVAKWNSWPWGRYGELEVRNETKPYQRDELHPKTAVKIFETEFRKPQIAKRLLRLRNHPRSKDMIFLHLELFLWVSTPSESLPNGQFTFWRTWISVLLFICFFIKIQRSSYKNVVFGNVFHCVVLICCCFALFFLFSYWHLMSH